MTACAGVGGPARVSILPDQRGTFVEKEPRRGERSLFEDRHRYQLSEATRTVACAPGQLFGALFEVRMEAAGSLPQIVPTGTQRGGAAQVRVGGGSHLRAVALQVRWEHPPLLDRRTARMATSKEWTRTVQVSDLAAYPYFFGWQLEPGRLTNGEWRLLISFEGELLRQERFMVAGC
jgi:hypothetical protein